MLGHMRIYAIVALLAIASAAFGGERKDLDIYREHRHGETMRCYWYEAEALVPHNAAARVLEFSYELNLTHEQVSRIVSLVEDYDHENRDREKEWEVSRQRLYNLLRGENIDYAQAVEYADNITRIEFYLWQEFIHHMQQVKEILTDVQNRSLKRLWEIRCRPH